MNYNSPIPTYQLDNLPPPLFDFGETNFVPLQTTAQVVNAPRPQPVEEPPRKIAKHTKTQEISDHPQTAVTLPRDKLLTYTRQDLDEYVAQVTKGRTLTKEERKEVSRQRKLIKNRKSAAASRKRKRDQLDGLEQTYQEKLKESRSINERLASLEAENRRMKDELGFLHNMITSNPVVTSMLQSAHSVRKQYHYASDSVKQTAMLVLTFMLFVNIILAMPGSSYSGVNQSNAFPTFYHPSEVYPDSTIQQPVHDTMSASLEGDRYVPTLMPPGWRHSDSNSDSGPDRDSMLMTDASQSYSAQSTPADQIFDNYSDVPDPSAILAFLDESGPSFGFEQSTADQLMGEYSVDENSRVTWQLPQSPPEVPPLTTTSPPPPSPTPSFDFTQLFYPTLPLPSPNHNPQIF